MNSCPECCSRIIWKVVFPRSPCLSCLKCGHNWSDSLLETECQSGIALGDWDDVELYKLELQLKCDNISSDWYFFKGRKIWSAWRNWWGAEDIIVTKMLDDLIHWVSLATTDRHWKREYNEIR